jgi:LPPG:FO 2-phospho-L-lactate transferase
MNKYVVLAGGVGAARFLEGLVQVIPQEKITVIVNTGDDQEFYGLHVSPDIDTILYTLSGKSNIQQGWGLQDETYAVMNELKKLGDEAWFTLGDKDIATHMLRTGLLKQGKTLAQVTDHLRSIFHLSLKLIPMSNDTVRTYVTTPAGELPFQEYFVKRHFQDEVQHITFKGIQKSKPAPGVLEAIKEADAIIIAPSNPLVSIRPILDVPEIKDTIQHSRAPKIAVSPIVGGAAIKGPADRMLKGLGLEVSALGIAEYYKDLIDTIIIDSQDESLVPSIKKIGINAIATNTLMKNSEIKKALAETVIQSCSQTL